MQGVAVFPAEGFQVSSSYQELVLNKFGGKTESLAYSTPIEAADRINRWAQEKTGDKVQELVTNLDPQTQLLLATTAFYQSMYQRSHDEGDHWPGVVAICHGRVICLRARLYVRRWGSV